jgi:Xaa-Pro aminopeptidase
VDLYQHIFCIFQKQLQPDSYVGADPRTIPHQIWKEWERELKKHNYLRLIKVKNLVDVVWGVNRIQKRDFEIKYYNSTYHGESWMQKVEKLREILRIHKCDAMVVTSLTEIAYLLNLRGGDFTYLPVFRAYLVVSQRDGVILYTNRTKVSTGALLSLHYDLNENKCYQEKCVM